MYYSFLLLSWWSLNRFLNSNLGCCHLGKALCLALAERGIFITVVDYSEEKGKQVAALAEKQIAKFHNNLKFPCATFIRCDVTNSGNFQLLPVSI